MKQNLRPSLTPSLTHPLRPTGIRLLRSGLADGSCSFRSTSTIGAVQFLFSALGSAGDVHPFIAIGEALSRRGHGVRLLAAPPFEDRVRRAGLEFIPLGLPGEFEQIVQRAELWSPRRGALLLLGELLDRLPEAFDHLMPLAAARPETVLVGSTLSWAVRLVQEVTGLPAATVHLAPSCLPSAFDPPVLAGIGELSWMPPAMVRALQWAGERFVTDPLIAPRLDRLRARLGLPPARRILSRWMHSPDLVVGAWPAWFAAPQPDWPSQATTAGFPLFGEAAGAALEPALAAFLAEGPPPIGITPGSAMAHGRHFFAAALEACDRLGRRAVLVTPYADQLPASLPRSVHPVGYAPFGRLLPQLSALAHHGGIGTSAQALAAGIPQLVVPFAHDQFDNAARLRRLGVAVTVDAAAGSAAWARGLAALAAPSVGIAVERAAARMAAGEPAAASIARSLERLGADAGGGAGR